MTVDPSALPTRLRGPVPDRVGGSRSTRLRAVGATVAIGAVLVGCGSTASTTGSTTSTAATGSAGLVTTTSASTGGTTPATASVTVVKVSANTASAAEIQKALEAAGVTNAARWTKEVMEYRPYAADDVNLSALKKELAKYNPSPETLAAILSALTP